MVEGASERAVRAGWFRDAFEQALIGMALVGLDGRWLVVNRAFPALLGYTEPELLATPFSSSLDLDEQATERTVLERLLDSAGEAYTTELRATHKDSRVLWFLCSVALVREATGAPAYFITQVQDITARKRAEAAQAATQTQLAHSNLALQEFASIAAHDLQEPLRKIQAFGDRLRLRHGTALGPTGGDYLARMQDAAARMQRLITDLLALARLSATARPFEPVDLAVVAREVLGDLETHVARTGGQVALGDLPIVEGDPTQLRQLLQNLIGNALKFHRSGHPPIVRIGADIRLRGTTHADEPPGRPPAPPVCVLTVADDGIGFDAQYEERIFGVFQRLHGRSEYEGTGIGLAICRVIAERHGGTIVATSALDQGATFTVTLPLRQPHQGA